MEDVLAEVRSHLLGLFQTSVQLLCFVEGVVAAKGLALAFSILLEEQGRGRDLVDLSTDTNRHASLLPVKHHLLHVQLVVWLARTMRLRLRLRIEVRHLYVLGARSPRATNWLEHAMMVLSHSLTLLVSAAQLSGSLEELERVVVLQLLEAARVEGRLGQGHLAEEDLLALLRIVVVLEHLVKHEVEELLIRHQ